MGRYDEHGRRAAWAPPPGSFNPLVGHSCPPIGPQCVLCTIALEAAARAHRDPMVSLLEAVVESVALEELEPDAVPCDGCGFVDCPTGGRCPDMNDDDWNADEAARCWREDQDDDPDPRPGEVDDGEPF